MNLFSHLDADTLAALATFLVKVTLLLGAAWLLRIPLQRANPRWRVLLWRGTLAGVLAIPIFSLFVVPVEFEVPIAVEATPAAVADAEPVRSSGHALPAEGDVAANRYGWAVLLLAGWCLGAVALAARYAVRTRRSRRLLAEASPAPEHVAECLARVVRQMESPWEPHVACSDAIRSPMLVGVRRPVILLPESIAAQSGETELVAVFAHEVAHLRSSDLLWLGAIHLLEAVLWFHPAVWGIRSAYCRDIEEVADGVAAQHTGDVQTYSSILARVALEMNQRTTLAASPGLAMVRLPEIRLRLAQLASGVSTRSIPGYRTAGAALVGMIALAAMSGLSLVPERVRAVETSKAAGSSVAAPPATAAQKRAESPAPPAAAATASAPAEKPSWNAQHGEPAKQPVLAPHPEAAASQGAGRPAPAKKGLPGTQAQRQLWAAKEARIASFTASNEQLGTVLARLGSQTGMKFVVDPAIAGNPVTINMTNAVVADVVRQVIQGSGATFSADSNGVVSVVPRPANWGPPATGRKKPGTAGAEAKQQQQTHPGK